MTAATPTNPAQRRAFIEQFCHQAATTPDAPALVTEQAIWSYGELDLQSTRLAQALLAAGFEPGANRSVGLFIDAQADYVLALLGVAKLGAVFMPLPPNSPPQRLRRSLDIATCRWVVTTAAWAPALEERLATTGQPEGLQILQLEEALNRTGADTLPEISIKPTDPAYVMFTSGSTGEPKAILGQQRGLSHFLRWETEEFGLDHRERVAWLAPINFDVSLRDILIPLTLGGSLHIPDLETRQMPHRLVRWIAAQALTLVHCVPTVLRLMIRELEQEPTADPFPALRHLLVAGEPLYVRDVQAWQAVAGTQTEIVNLYGPSETTLAKVYNRLGDLTTDLAVTKVLPIGRPLPNTNLVIVNQGRLCNPGEIGEILIQTPYRSLGYLNDPQATAAAFVPNPVTQDANDIVYRSGDLGRWLEDGTVECLGRMDGQVKVNGVRIELGEIETVLRDLPQIADAAVTVQNGGDGHNTLVGYYTRSDGVNEPLPEANLSAALGQTLPETMQPHLYVVMAELPRTISGKINRRALPRPEALFYAQHGYAAPEGTTEEQLARIWSDILGFQQISATIHFTQYGGDSLRAIKTVAAIHHHFGVEITLRDFFSEPTVRALAARIDAAQGQAPVTPIPRRPDAPHYPASAAQRRLWRLHRMGIAPTAYNLAESFVLEGPLNPGALEAAWRQLIDRHESLRTTFIEHEGEPRQVVHAHIDWYLERLDLRQHPDPHAESERLFVANRDLVFDLEQGPLLRALLASLPASPTGQARHLFLVNMHHIISDVWSLSVLVRELSAAYRAHCQGHHADFPALGIGYRDFTAWQEAAMDSDTVGEQRDYWLRQLSAPLPILSLPTDRMRPPVQTFNGDTQRFLLDAELTEQLASLARQQEITRFALWVALVKVLLHRYSGDEDLIVGTPVVGREHPDLEDQVGYYVNMLALRDRVTAHTSFSAFLAQVNQTVTQGLTRQSFPFDALIEALDLQRDMSRSPVFDVMVVEQAFEHVDLHLDGVHLATFGREEDTWKFSRYDMVFHLQTSPEGLVLDLNYNTDLFDAERIARCGEHFLQLARGVVLAPDTALGQLPLLDAREAEALQRFSQGPQVSRDPQATLWSLFAERAAQAPDHFAVVTLQQSLSFTRLSGQVEHLAQVLVQSHGVAAGEPVVVLARRSIASVTAMLALLRMGAVYVPVDPEHPEDYIRLLIERSRCRWVLADSAEDQALCPSGVAAMAMTVPDLLATSLDHNQSIPAPQATDLAYIIFTSGSTGIPKAVMIEHHSFINTALGQIESFGITPQDRVLQFASPAFDAAMANLFHAWLAGATVVLPTRAVLDHPAEFNGFMAATATTVVTLPPVYIRLLEFAPLPTLRILISAGEAAPVAELLHYARQMQVFNAYGPTEASVCATIQAILPEAHAGLERLPIGPPLPNTTLYILDSNQQPVPMGVTGEIWLGGAGLARGYQFDASLTAQAFVTHPHSGERLYRTGDLGRWRTDGSVDYLGRNDGQVKVRGHRIELGAVETALRNAPGVRDAYVLTQNSSDQTQALTGYFVPERHLELWPSVAEFYVYDDVVYRSMAEDEQRNNRYRRAFARYVRDRIVVDIGTGPFAILARLALEAGAKKVYAIDLLPESVRKARALVEKLGLADRIEIYQGDATQITLPELADVCISEIVGAIGGSEGSAKIINGSRHLLRDGSMMLPQRSLTLMAGVSLPQDRLELGFADIAAHYVEKIFAEVGQPFDLRLCVKNLPAEALITHQAPFEDLDYTQPIPLETEHEFVMEVTTAATLTGVLVWLTLHIDADNVVDILTSPGSWIPVYLPIFPDGVAVEPGDRLVGTVQRRLCHNGLNPDFILSGQLHRQTSTKPLDFRYVSAHFGEGFRVDPFHARLFASTEVPRLTRSTANATSVRRHLARSLPAYAVPAYLLELETLPLTVNGKVNVAALPSPHVQADNTLPPDESVPQDRITQAVLTVWCQVLEREHIGMEDNFFALGGDSIRAIQIIARLSQHGLTADIRDIFQHPSPAQFVAVVRSATHYAEQAPLTGLLPLGPIQRWFFVTIQPEPQHFNQAVELHSPTPWNPEALASALTALWTHHDALRSVFSIETGIINAQMLPASPAPQLVFAATEPWETAIAKAHTSFDLANGPLLRAIHDGQQRVVLLAHHLVIDAVSWGIVLQDLDTAYQTALAGNTPALPPKTNAYRDYSEAAITWAAEEQAALHRAIQYAAGLQGQLPMTDNARLTHTARLSAAQTEALGTYPASWETVILAVAGAAICRVFQCQSIVADLERHGRDLVAGLDLSRSVGWFTHFFPVHLKLASAQPPATLINQTAEAVAAVPDGGRGLALLAQRPHADLVVNHLGVLATSAQAGFTVNWDAPGPAISPRQAPLHAVEILSYIESDQLQVSISAAPAHANALLEAVQQCLEEFAQAAGAPQDAFGGWSDDAIEALLDG